MKQNRGVKIKVEENKNNKINKNTLLAKLVTCVETSSSNVPSLTYEIK